MDLPKLTPSKSNARDPPRFFLHPSPAASHVSLSGMMAAAPAVPPASASASNVRENASAASTTQQSQAAPSVARTSSIINPRNRATVSRLQTADSTRTADRTDALWAEMQATLEEVELSASGGTHVFGPEHDRKLAEREDDSELRIVIPLASLHCLFRLIDDVATDRTADKYMQS